MKERLADEQERLSRIAGLRAQYANLTAAVKTRTQLLEVAQRDLAAARGARPRRKSPA